MFLLLSTNAQQAESANKNAIGKQQPVPKVITTTTKPASHLKNVVLEETKTDKAVKQDTTGLASPNKF